MCAFGDFIRGGWEMRWNENEMQKEEKEWMNESERAGAKKRKMQANERLS